MSQRSPGVCAWAERAGTAKGVGRSRFADRAGTAEGGQGACAWQSGPGLRKEGCQRGEPMNPPAPDLAELRREIDRIDEAMHGLLMERSRIIDRLIAVKKT